MATQRKRTGRIQIGVGLISFSLIIVALAITIAAPFVNDLGVRLVIYALALALIAALWIAAIRNGRVEREARERLKAEHPGALVERVRLWSLPAGRVEPHLPMHFVIADASEISFETIDQTVLLRIPVADLGFVGTAKAKGDTAKDAAITLVYGDERHSVQLFTITYASLAKLLERLRVAIGWPTEGTP